MIRTPGRFRLARLFATLGVAMISSGLAGAAARGHAAETFTLTEHFGVAHPEQIITFDLAAPINPKKTAVTMAIGDAAAVPVPLQVLADGKKLAVRTSLGAGETRTFAVKPGSPAAAGPDAVTVRETDAWYEISNGLTGVRVPKAVDCATTQQVPAPVQGIRMRDGRWYGTGPNWLGYQSQADETKKTVATGMTVNVVERGPLRALVQIEYSFQHPELLYGAQKVKPAGNGYYRSTIKLEAGQPSICFEEDTDFEPSWSVELYDAVQPSHARYRGHHSSEKRFGYEPDGQAYRPFHQRPGLDAQVDLAYDRPRYPSYNTTDATWSLMATWNPWVVDSGWYWQLFNRDAPDSANLVGIFAGPASRLIGVHMSGVGIYTAPADKGKQPRFGISLVSHRRGPDARVFLRSRWGWGLFVGTKGADLKPATEIQPIARQMNLHGGINLEKIHRYTLNFPDPPQGYGAMYMPKPAVEALIAKLRADKDFFTWACNAETMGRPLIDFWADTTGKQAEKVTGEIDSLARTFLDQFVNGDGIYNLATHYWHGGLEMSRKLVWLDQLMGSDQTTPEQKRRLKAIAVLFGSILHDNDFVPLDNPAGINLGNANMPIQQQNYRQMYALFLARHPLMKERAAGVAGAAKSMLARTVNEHGAHMGSLHYVGAANGPLLATFQQLQMAGIYDGFASEERLAKFAEFYLQALSPPEVRFGGTRLMVAIGDGTTEGTEEYGMLGTGFAKTNPALSKRLMGAWRENGKVHTGFHGSTFLKIDDELPGESPKLTDASYPGYYSILRSGWGTPEENAVWCVNGNFYADHCHNDLGTIVAYLLGAPVAIDWGPIYYPRVAGGAMHSGVIQESAFGQAWDKDIASLAAGVGFSSQYEGHGIGEGTSLDVFPQGRRMVSTIKSGLRNGGKPEDVTSWVRTITLVTADPEKPVLVIQDTFSGKDAAAPKIFTLNLMADGAVETPAGPQTPPLRMHPAAEKPTDPATQMPSAGKVFPLSPGVNRLGCTGQKWKGHPTEGIDWDCYVIPREPQQAQIGNWGNQWNQPSGGLFSAAQGRPFEERQHILRVRGTGSFTTVIVPWKKGKKPEGLEVSTNGEEIVVKTATSSVTVDSEGKIR